MNPPKRGRKSLAATSFVVTGPKQQAAARALPVLPSTPESSGYSMNILAAAAMLFALASASQAQVFTHEVAGKRVEAEVTTETLAIREKSTSGSGKGSDFVCPLGTAVRANVVPAASGGGKVCFVIARDRCNGSGATATSARNANSSAFKCIDLATPQEADAIAALVNAGPQQPRVSPLARPAASAVVPPPSASQNPKSMQQGSARAVQRHAAPPRSGDPAVVARPQNEAAQKQ